MSKIEEVSEMLEDIKTIVSKALEISKEEEVKELLRKAMRIIEDAIYTIES